MYLFYQLILIYQINFYHHKQKLFFIDREGLVISGLGLEEQGYLTTPTKQ